MYEPKFIAAAARLLAKPVMMIQLPDVDRLVTEELNKLAGDSSEWVFHTALNSPLVRSQLSEIVYLNYHVVGFERSTRELQEQIEHADTGDYVLPPQEPYEFEPHIRASISEIFEFIEFDAALKSNISFASCANHPPAIKENILRKEFARAQQERFNRLIIEFTFNRFMRLKAIVTKRRKSK